MAEEIIEVLRELTERIIRIKTLETLIPNVPEIIFQDTKKNIAKSELHLKLALERAKLKSYQIHFDIIDEEREADDEYHQRMSYRKLDICRELIRETQQNIQKLEEELYSR